MASKESIVVLETHVGEDLVIRSGPTDAEVKDFVKEAVQRFKNGQPGGPSGIPAYGIFNATRYQNELGYLTGDDKGKKINIADLL